MDVTHPGADAPDHHVCEACRREAIRACEALAVAREAGDWDLTAAAILGPGPAADLAAAAYSATPREPGLPPAILQSTISAMSWRAAARMIEADWSPAARSR